MKNKLEAEEVIKLKLVVDQEKQAFLVSGRGRPRVMF